MLYYQDFQITTVTNDAAVKIANFYRNPDSAIVMGFISDDALNDCGMGENALLELNSDKEEKYIKKRISKYICVSLRTVFWHAHNNNGCL